MALASVYTKLSLDRYAEIIGLNPLRFNGCQEVHLASGPKLFPVVNDVHALWPQYAWQNNVNLSREDLALEIYRAEQQIEKMLGFPLCSTWVKGEQQEYPQYYKAGRMGSGYNWSGQWKSVNLEYGEFRDAGVRALEELALDESVVYSDVDGDGFNELATISFSVTEEIEDLSQVKVYVSGKDGEQRWEIRPKLSIDSSSLTITVTFNVWQMIKPSVYEAFPTDENYRSGVGIDITDVDNLLETVDVYREYSDTTQESVTFHWNPSSYNNMTASDEGGTIFHVNNRTGAAMIAPAYHDGNSWHVYSKWQSQSYEPNTVELNYRAGSDEMNRELEYAVAMLATTRI